MSTLLDLIPLSKGVVLQMEWLMDAVTTCIRDNLLEECPFSAAKLASKYSRWELLTAAATVALKQKARTVTLLSIFELAGDPSALLVRLANEATTQQYLT